MRFLFLLTELNGYLGNCIQLLRDETHADIKVIYRPYTKNAPFALSLSQIEVADKSSFSIDQLILACLEWRPDIVFISGWADRDYMRVVHKLKKNGIIIVAGVDTVWTGSLRQQVGCLLSTMVTRPYSTHMWVAGHKQYQFAERLGYSDDQILTGLYAADVRNFKTIQNYAHGKYLVFVGRFEPEKGVQLLYDAFNSLSADERKGWKLKMIGRGSLKINMPATADIEIHDFLQPQQLVPFIADSGGFILASINEPWGVVVQEFAAAGKPLLLSSAVNSGEAFLIHNYNGLKFQSGNFNSLKSTLVRFFNLSDEERTLMGIRSTELAEHNEPKYWIAKLMSLTVQ